MDAEKIVEAVASGTKPASYFSMDLGSNGKLAVAKANEKNLEVMFESHDEGNGKINRFVAISRPGLSALSVVNTAHEEFADFQFGKVFALRYTQIGNMTAAEALHYLQARLYERAALGSVATANRAEDILLGMLCGYPSCCIWYFVNSRYRDFPRHEFEDQDKKTGVAYLRCSPCASEDLLPPWHTKP